METQTHASKKQLAIEIVLVAILFLGTKYFLMPIKYSAQIAELMALFLITGLLFYRKSNWKQLGFEIPEAKLKAILLSVLCVVTIALTFNFVVQPLFPHGTNDINHGEAISFNEMLFQLIFIGIGMAAIGEEMLFRGFLLNHLNTIFGHNKAGTIIAVLVQAIMFGLLHSGIQGQVSATVIGLILGTYYILAKRNLLVVMLAHAVPDVISIISSYQNQ